MSELFRPRVLLIAESANPEWTSVPLVGWSHARALARLADTHLVTQVRNREAILRAGLVEGSDFTAVDSEAVARPLFRLASRLTGGSGRGWTTLTALSSASYPYFEWRVWRQFGERIAGGEFQVVHRLTPLSPTAPSLLARRCRRVGVPFVLGPLNGGLPWPRGYDRVRRQEREWLSYVRPAHKLLPGYRSTRRDAAALVVGSAATRDQLPPRYHDKCVYIPENGFDPGRFPGRRSRRASLPIRVVFLGRLVPYKGADLLLEAAAPLIRQGSLRVDLIGDGPQMPQLRELARREALGDGVTFRGWVGHREVHQFLTESDLLALPSVREFGGAVVLEAMAVGVVPVVVNYGGPAELATESTGFLVELGNRSQLVERLRDVLARVVADPSVIDRKGLAALSRAHAHFTWDAKAHQMMSVYRWVLGRSPDRPAFPIPLPDDSA